ncbi:Glyoxalase/Bleomycin resistance protein/Dihydroxybiphenyl dioxygenase [Lindgomyces ingoldianus]|uniref:Glyoxalase/Bleomycin resistance protein/Dihydroxybiphenyl dioxygenase n=1 Tax=Lindgomyces ingoldianus TaxID=673940 RepID=A0ACB6QHN1_9PLEO|nr:Glyoxalase/Bleomycin resistance protein/Dihydroxybiphenyl dioxygenase [Lindgomyces ingoldianus]KAF2465852.1 Glyoxalase/Bleomycin resistance protein/Dihydroxybiphenyl dioxygenase [Lindgomyces ingoldianus]
MAFTPTLFVNLPVLSLSTSTPFYLSLGFTPNPTFSSSDTTCMTLSPAISVMLMEHSRFQSFMPGGKALVGGKVGTEVLLCFNVEKKEDVDRIVEAAGKAGGKMDPTVLPQIGGSYGRSVEDPDGHVWEVGWFGGMGGDGCAVGGEKGKDGGKDGGEE